MNKELDFLLYSSPLGDETIRVVMRDETIWATQKAMAEIFDVDRSVVTKHIQNIFAEQELSKDQVCAKIAHTANDGKNYTTQFYNLDAIIAIGYRVNSKRATHFRQWATSVLREYTIKGFAMDDERLKYGEKTFGKDYFRELLERVRSIRASERRIWLQITDIFAEISVDYEKDSQVTKDFYATVQNKFHYAITGQTAAEIVFEKANHKKANMGLTTWKNSPDGRILKSDAEIAKNYLDEGQIRRLERSVSGFFDYVEDLIESERIFTMVDFAKSIDDFINFREWKILDGKGKIPHKLAMNKAHSEYNEFNKTQKIDSDFEKQLRATGGEK